MSKVAIAGNASGTGTLTVAAPNTNSDYTLTLPAETGTVLTSGTPLSSFPSGFENGITEVDFWHITATLSLSIDTATILDTNWTQTSNTKQGLKGSGMSQSSGVFSFPSTGIWRIDFLNTFEKSGAVRQLIGRIEVSDNGGSTWDIHSMGNSFINFSGDYGYASANTIATVNVDSTTNVKVRFSVFSNDATSNLVGEPNYVRTGAVFVRLGDN